MSPMKLALAGALITAAVTGGSQSCGIPQGSPTAPAPVSPTVPSNQFERDLLHELTRPLPYNGGDPNGPCGSWGAATKADADQMDTAWHHCMASHH